MKTRFDRKESFAACLAILTFWVATTVCAPVAAQDQPQTQSTQAKPERFWLAGRYDGNRVVVYFDAVKFNNTVPSIAEQITKPVAYGFFRPVKLPWTYIAKFQQRPDAEHFKLGDQYDLLMDEGRVATITLTTMIGTEGDEPVGNDSYIGALATLNNDGDLFSFSKDYYVVRRHHDVPDGARDPSNLPTPHAHLERDPVRFDIQTEIVALLTDRMKAMATESERHSTEGLSPITQVQAFRLADGSLRYYARAAWNSEVGTEVKTPYALAALISSSPTLHVLEVQKRTSRYDDGMDVLPTLLNVIDIGEGRIGIIVYSAGQDGEWTRLLEYREGVDLWHMRILQSLEWGE